MPVERLYPVENDSASNEPRHIHVQWGRDMPSINVGVVHDTPDKAMVEAYINLEHRGEVNRLIRTLRKARDQAFGTDA